jgi:isoleucyl-tRNA synthetase
LINRVQNLRKAKEFEVTDRINVSVTDAPFISEAVRNNLSYICAEILADSLVLDNQLNEGEKAVIDENEIYIAIRKS